MASNIGPKIGIEGEKEFRNQIKQLNQEVKTFGSELKAAAAAAEAGEDAEKSLTKQKAALEKQIASQAEKLAALQKRLEQTADAFGENSTEALAMAKQVADAETDLYKMNSTLKKVSDELDDLEREARGAGDAVDGMGDDFDDAAKDMKKLGDEAKDAGDSLGKGGLGGALDELKGLLGGGALGDIVSKGLGIGTVVGAVKELGSALMGVVTDTQEYRKIMASLDNSSKRAGYNAEQTRETYLQLYEVLGDQQTAATATANLQALGLSQQQLTQMTYSAIGAWATYGDSIPIDGLAEAINETVQTGKVTGTFADVLNWASGATETFGIQMRENTKENEDWNKQVQDCASTEDYFNLALQQCKTESERVNLMLQHLSDQGLAQAGQAWRDSNEDITTVNRATAEYDEALADLGRTLAPVATAFMRFATVTIRSVISAIKEAITWFNNLFTAKNKATGLAADSNYKGSSAYRYDTQPRSVNGSHATGLDYVPWDGYVAELHKGEMILPAGVAQSLRAQMTQGRSSGGTMQPITLIVQSVLDGRVIAESVTRTQAQLKRAGGLA